MPAHDDSAICLVPPRCGGAGHGIEYVTEPQGARQFYIRSICMDPEAAAGQDSKDADRDLLNTVGADNARMIQVVDRGRTPSDKGLFPRLNRTTKAPGSKPIALASPASVELSSTQLRTIAFRAAEHIHLTDARWLDT